MKLNTKEDKNIEFLQMGIDLDLNGEKYSYRFRTIFSNLNNEKFFVEFGANKIEKNDKRAGYARFRGKYIFRIDHLFRLKYVKTNIDPLYANLEKAPIDFLSKKNLLKFLNDKLNCNFSNLIISDNLAIEYKNYTITKKETK